MAQDASQRHEWPINHFKVHFGSRGQIVATPQFFTDFTDEQVANIESLLHRTARELEDLGFPQPRLADVTTLDDGTEAFEVFLYEYEGAPARYLVACEGEDVRPRIDLNAGSYLEDGKIASKAFSDTVHELVHAVQRGTTLFKNECDPGTWIAEGSAEAVGHDMARVLRGTTVEKRGTNMAIMRWGGRDYSKPLRVADTSNQTNKELSYQSSSFWRYLAELTDANLTGSPKPGPEFHETDYSYLPRILDRRISGSGEEAELQWIHEALVADPAIDSGLDVVYPNFVSVMAGYGRRIDSALPKDQVLNNWLKGAFVDCHQVGLSPTSPDRDIEVTMGRVTAECIQVRFSGRSGAVPVSFKALDPNPKVLEQLSMSKLGDSEALRADVKTNDDGSSYAEWTFLLDSPGPSYAIISNVKKGVPQHTEDVAFKLRLALDDEPVDGLAAVYQSLLPTLPEALRQELLRQFRNETPADQQVLIDRLRSKEWE